MLFTRRASAIAGLVLAAAVLAWSLAPEGERVTLSVPAHAERTSAAPPPIATPSRGTAPPPGTPAVAGAAREAAINASSASRLCDIVVLRVVGVARAPSRVGTIW